MGSNRILQVTGMDRPCTRVVKIYNTARFEFLIQRKHRQSLCFGLYNNCNKALYCMLLYFTMMIALRSEMFAFKSEMITEKITDLLHLLWLLKKGRSHASLYPTYMVTLERTSMSTSPGIHLWRDNSMRMRKRATFHENAASTF